MSPYELIQEFLRDQPWRLLVACCMLNQTSSKQVWPVLPRFFERYPEPLDAAQADPTEMASVIRPLGLQNRRARTIIAMSAAWSVGDFEEVTDLPGVGKYGSDSYRLFVMEELVEDVEDKELERYLRWAKDGAHDV